jgi:hypothetical protein
MIVNIQNLFILGFTSGFVITKNGALDSQVQVIKFTSYLPMVGGSLRVLRLLITVTSTNDCQYTEFIYPKADCIILHNYIKIVSKLV